MDKKKAWAILKPIKKNGEIVKIFESKFTFGRSEGVKFNKYSILK